jgi:hypothetical protein
MSINFFYILVGGACMEIANLICAAIIAIGTILLVLPILGVDVRIFGRPKMAEANAVVIPAGASLKVRAWLALTFACLALLWAGFSAFHRHELATDIQITSPELFTPPNPQYHFGLRVRLETDVDRSVPTEVLLICSGDIAEGTEKFSNGSGMSLLTASTKVVENHRDVIILKWGEPWKKDNPVVVELFSDHPLSAKYVVPINYRGNQPYI